MNFKENQKEVSKKELFLKSFIASVIIGVISCIINGISKKNPFEPKLPFLKPSDCRSNYYTPSEKIECWTKKADKGDVSSQRFLGWHYTEGMWVPENYTKAIKYYGMAAKQGDFDSQEHIFKLKFENATQRYIPYIIKRAKKGIPSYQLMLATMYQNGENEIEQSLKGGYENYSVEQPIGYGVLKDKDEALKWYRKAAFNGDNEAQFLLYKDCERMSYSMFFSIEKYRNPLNAIRLLKKAAINGNVKAQYELGNLYKKSLDIRSYRRKILLAKNTKNLSTYEIKRIELDKKFSERLYQFDKNEKYRNTFQFSNVISRYKGNENSDFKKAFRWYRKAAFNGSYQARKDINSMYNIYQYDKNINIVNKNRISSFLRDFLITSKVDNKIDIREKINFIKEKYLQNYIRLVEIKAINGDIESQKELGYLYQEGKGVIKDKEKALMWFKTAAQNGDEYSKSKIKLINEYY